ncbi:DUF935 domain-containing protein [Brevibacterium moorei]|uniref:DUF935 domain-containing protein n=1 Tax=Brevibacterium moorei TaxID=2968457 RepID=UPI00211BB3B3|nr:DUF935 domain-containing protein [Brevibacterium sp. 68QC2CO]MCQ9384438.1 DUF935 domain-containing protein [Brevibacterium sp. 68QC2CO]
MEASYTPGRDRKTTYTPRPDEHTWELEYPLCNAVYSQMKRSDGQVASLLKAIRLPIQGAHWQLTGDDVRPEVMEFVTKDLGVTLPGEGRTRRRRNGIVWGHHVREALNMLAYGHMFFEQVYHFTPTDPTHIHLRKLAPRMPQTITQIQVERDGGLAGIWQEPLDLTRVHEPIFIPVDRLVGYVLDQEGGDWTGSSILRTAYKHWLIKDVLMRVDAQSVERNGMGIPVVKYDPTIPGAKEDAEEIVRNVRAGEAAGVALPVGDGLSDFSLVGVSGSTVDAVARMNYHDQQTSRSALAMFLDLGHDAGARSLGESQTDFFLSSLQSVADDIAEVATEHIIRDLVEVNWGPDEPYPVMSPGRLADNGAITSESLATLTTAGLLTPDARLEDYVRTRSGLPEADPSTARQQDVDTPTPAGAPIPTLAEDDTALARVESILARMSELEA